MVARPFDGRELGDNIKNLGAGATRTDGVRDDAGLGQGDRALHARDPFAAIGLLRGEAAFEALPPGAALRARHDPDERQRACRTACEVGLRSRRSAVAVLAGEGIDRRGWRGSRARSSNRTASGSASPRARASCWPAADFPTMSPGARNCFPTRRRATSTTRPDRRATPAMGCVSPKRSAARSTPLSARRRLGSGVGHDAEGRLEGSDAALHRSREARRHRGDHDGKRFTNEGNSYHDFVQAMVAACAGKDEVAAYLICDHRTLRKYGLGCCRAVPAADRAVISAPATSKGGTLARARRKDRHRSGALEATVRDVNVHAREGKDPAFGKGSKAYNRYQGDALHAPNPCVAPLENGPFYAIKLVVGDLGTYAGLMTDEHSRVLDGDRQPIAGLYAVGNDIASIMGGNYPGCGHHARPGADLRPHRGLPHRRRPTGLSANIRLTSEDKRRAAGPRSRTTVPSSWAKWRRRRRWLKTRSTSPVLLRRTNWSLSRARARATAAPSRSGRCSGAARGRDRRSARHGRGDGASRFARRRRRRALRTRRDRRRGVHRARGAHRQRDRAGQRGREQCRDHHPRDHRQPEGARKLAQASWTSTSMASSTWFTPGFRRCVKTRGSIINVASIASFVGVGDTLGYSPSKGRGEAVHPSARSRTRVGRHPRKRDCTRRHRDPDDRKHARGSRARLAGFHEAHAARARRSARGTRRAQ